MRLLMACLIDLQFSRTVAPDTSKGPALISFMQHSKWRKIAVISSTESHKFETRTGLAKQLEDASITVLTPAAFEPRSLTDATLGQIRQAGMRIVLVLTYPADAQSAALLARRAGMTSGYAWLVESEKDAVADMAGWLCFRSFLASDMQAFAKQVSDHSKSHFNITVRPDSVDLTYSAALYDAVMLYAHAATAVISDGGDLHDGEAVAAAVRSTTFTGMGGVVVALDSNSDRVESYEVMNYVLNAGDVLRTVAVGVFNATLNEYKAYEQAVVWPGDTTDLPAHYFSGALLLDRHGPPALNGMFRDCSIRVLRMSCVWQTNRSILCCSCQVLYIGSLVLLLSLLRGSMPTRLCAGLSTAGLTQDAALSRGWRRWASYLEGRAGSML